MVRLLLALAGLLFASGCRSHRPPDVVLVTIDTLRADHCSTYGYRVETTPTLSRLAAEGMRFDTAYSPAPQTGPSHAALFTSRWPRAAGVRRNGDVLGDAQVTLAERLREAGFATGAFVSAYPITRRFGYPQGFDVYDDELVPLRPGEVATFDGIPLTVGYERPGDRTVARAAEWIGRAPAGQPLFVWLHLFEPHSPYDPARVGQGTIERYDAEVLRADRHLAAFLTAFAARDRPRLTIVTSDHGEGLGDHGEAEHGATVFDSVMRVPLVLAGAGITPGVERAPVSLLDVVPTVLRLAGQPAVAGLHGQDLLQPRRPGPLFFEALQDDGATTVYGLRRDRWKYVETRAQGAGASTTVFDLVADPGETQPVASADRDAMAAELTAWRRAHPATTGEPMPPEVEEALRTLGYVR